MDATAVILQAGHKPTAQLVNVINQLYAKEVNRGMSAAQAEAAVLGSLMNMGGAAKKAKPSKPAAMRGDDDENAVEEEIEAEVFTGYR